MVMEGENEHFSSLDITDSVLQQPEPESWTSVYHQDTTGEQDTPEAPEDWEQIIWPMRPMTCTSPPLSFATVQWDMPDAAAETSSLITECGVVSELGSGSVTIIDATSLSPHQYQDVHFTQEVKEEDDWRIDSQLLDSVLQRAGCDSEPCDAADMQQPTAQEKEDSAHELLHHYNEIPSTDSEVEEEHSATSDPIETADFTDILEETEHSEDEVDSFIDLKLEEEQQEACVLLTGQRNLEEEHISLRGVETEEGGAEWEERSVIDLTHQDECKEETFGSCLNEEEVLEELLQSDDTGLLINENEEQGSSESEEDVEMLQQPQDDPTGQSEEPEMCKDIDQNGEPRESEASQDNEELLMEEGDNTERIENSQEVLELTAKPEEVRCLPHEDCDQEGTSQKLSPQAKHLDHFEMTEDSEQMQSKEEHQLGQSKYLEQLTHVDLAEEAAQPENADLPDESASDDTICVRAAEQQEQTEPSEQKEQMTNVSPATLSEQLVQPQEADDSEITEQLPAEAEATRQTSEAEFNQVDKQSVASDQVEEVGGSEGGSAQTLLANGKQLNPPETTVPCANGCEVVSEMACRLAERLFKLDGIQRVDVVKHLDKDNDFSRAVGEEYLKFFDFTGQTLDHALRSFLKVVVLIGETQERERVLQHFACRFHQCNPDSFSSSGAVLALTCALMLLNTDLHGQNVGKSMSSSKFVFNLDGMNEGQNFNKDLLKSLYNSIKNEPLEWAVDEGELVSSLFVDEDASSDATVRSKTNPFLDFPQDSKASEVKEGLLQRKLHADVDGKRTPWGKRGWKTFHGVLRGMVLYLEKVDYRRDHPVNEEVVSVHHSLAEPASEYTKKPHVFRLQTADWRVFLFQASCKVEMNSWISRINLVSALQSSPPFPAAVGSQRRFFRPILPTLQSAHSLERQLQSHSGMLQSFKADLSYLQKNPPERKKAKAKELEEHRIRAQYLRHEMRRYESYIQVLAAWNNVTKSDADVLSATDLNLFDKALCAESVGEDEEEDGLKKSHSTPALAEMALPSVIKVKRNISERRTYRRPVIPRFNKEA